MRLGASHRDGSGRVVGGRGCALKGAFGAALILAAIWVIYKLVKSARIDRDRVGPPKPCDCKVCQDGVGEYQ